MMDLDGIYIYTYIYLFDFFLVDRHAETGCVSLIETAIGCAETEAFGAPKGE